MNEEQAERLDELDNLAALAAMGDYELDEDEVEELDKLRQLFLKQAVEEYQENETFNKILIISDEQSSDICARNLMFKLREIAGGDAITFYVSESDDFGKKMQYICQCNNQNVYATHYENEDKIVATDGSIFDISAENITKLDALLVIVPRPLGAGTQYLDGFIQPIDIDFTPASNCGQIVERAARANRKTIYVDLPERGLVNHPKTGLSRRTIGMGASATANIDAKPES